MDDILAAQPLVDHRAEIPGHEAVTIAHRRIRFTSSSSATADIPACMPSRSLSSLFLVAAALGGVSGSAAAQANPIVGTWKISFVAGTRVENGTPTTINGTGKLIVELRRDSLVARLIPIASMRCAPESRMAAPTGADKVSFIQRGMARVNLNGEEKEVTSISTWTLAAKGDALEGTVERRLEGMDTPSRGPQPVTGKRLKG